MRNQIILLLLAAGPQLARANAFNVNEADAKATGRGNATTASDTGPSSIFYNVGGLAVEDGTNVLVGGTVILARADFTDSLTGEKTSTNNNPAGLPQLYITSRIYDVFSAGVGLSTPFGLSLRWPTTSPLGVINTWENLKTLFITPAIGANLDQWVPGLSVGGGLDVVWSTVQFKRNLLFGDATGQANLGATTTGVGGRVGAMYRPAALPELAVGAMWRSMVGLSFNGTGDFNISDPTFRPALPLDGPVSTTITLPQSVNFGASYHVIPDLEIEADGVWMNWSTLQSLDIHATGVGNVPLLITSPRNYNDTWGARVGVEYALTEYNAAVRAGYMYDPTPIPRTTLGPDLPDVNRNIITVGGSMQFGDYGVSVGFLGVLPSSRNTASMADTQLTQEFHGKFDVEAFVMSASVTGRFGGTTKPVATTSSRMAQQ
jgi:long-chain fatty acid transport protein